MTDPEKPNQVSKIDREITSASSGLEKQHEGKVNYAKIFKDVKSSETEATIATFSLSKDAKTGREYKQFDNQILMTDKNGNIGVIGFDNATVGMDIHPARNVLMDKLDPSKPVDVLNVTYLAVITPDGQVHGEMPEDLKAALVAGDYASGYSYFYGGELLDGLKKQISQQRFLENKSDRETE